jgi:hypothetical protein
MIARPLADERREADHEMGLVRVPHEREDVLSGIGARGEHEALHRVEIDVEAREPALERVVERACANDGDARTHDVQPLRLELREIARARRDGLFFGGERLTLRAPAEVDVMGRARSTKQRARVDRQSRDEIVR